MILGLDPGLANTGWAVINNQFSNSNLQLEKCGVIKTGVKEDGGVRLNKIYEGIKKIIRENKIEEVALESLFFARNARSAIKVAEAIGVIKVCGRQCRVGVFEYTPLQVKMALVGYGRAEKEQVERMVRSILNLEKSISPSHAADAVAVALTHVFTNQELQV